MVVSHNEREKAIADAMGTAIRDAMESAGITQGALAQATGMALNTLSRRLNGWTPFTWPEIFAIAAALGVGVADLANDAARIARSYGVAA